MVQNIAKTSTLWVERNNVTVRRQTDGETDGLCRSNVRLKRYAYDVRGTNLNHENILCRSCTDPLVAVRCTA